MVHNSVLSAASVLVISSHTGLLEAVAEGAEAQPQEARGLGLVAAGLFEGSLQVVPLQIGEQGVQIDPLRGQLLGQLRDLLDPARSGAAADILGQRGDRDLDSIRPLEIGSG